MKSRWIKKIRPHNTSYLEHGFIASILEAAFRKRIDFFTLQSGQPCEKPPIYLSGVRERIDPGTSRVKSQHAKVLHLRGYLG